MLKNRIERIIVELPCDEFVPVIHSRKRSWPHWPVFFSPKVNKTRNTDCHITKKTQTAKSSVPKTLLCYKLLTQETSSINVN